MARYKSDCKLFISCVIPAFAVALAIFAPAAAQEPQNKPAEKAENPQGPAQPTPGMDVKIFDKQAGLAGYYLVYLPPEYTPERPWPVIFCYHGLNGKPTTKPFKKILAGKHFVIIGMGYYKGGKDGYEHQKTDDVKLLKHVLQSVDERVKIDRDKLFVGGFSKGAFYAAGMVAELPKAWAGALMLGGGGKQGFTPNRKALRGKPIFIGCGEKDVHHKYAEKAKTYFSDIRADVTYETWPGVGHAIDYKNSKVAQWLLAHGPLKGVKARLLKARQYENAGRLGLAYKFYLQLAGLSETNETCQAAAGAAGELAAAAEKRLAHADEAIEEKRYSQAADLLGKISADYKKSPFADQADEKLRKLRSDPAIQSTIEQARIDAQADALEAQAREAEKANQYVRAIRLYEQYVAKYAKAGRFTKVKAHLAKLKSDDALQASIREKKAANECQGWLSLADNYIESGKSEQAKKYLMKIIRNYGQTSWALKAKARLEMIE